MTTDNFDSELHDDPLGFWRQRIKACRWMITKTVTLGACAAGVGVLGQGWLEDAAPLFPFISQNYGIWQSVYLLALLIIFFLWLFAMRQRMGLLENSKQGMRAQMRIEERNERRAQLALEAKERREKSEAERSAAAFFKANSRSNKFDY